MIGIFGGTFNPPHTEHLNIAVNAKKELGLEKVVLVPTFNAPHKYVGASFSDRIKMCELCFEDAVTIDEIENTTGKERNYAFEVLEELQKKYKDIIYIIGGDSLLALDNWKNPEKILTRFKIAVVPRNDDRELCKEAIRRYEKCFNARLILLEYDGKRVSSQVIRGSICLGIKPEYLKQNVYEYIIQNDLYSEYKPLVARVRDSLKKERFDHVCGVVIKALKLNEKIGLPFDKVFLAALLHDVAKGSLQTNDGVPINAVGTSVAHQFSGAYLAKETFKIEDQDVLNAIRYHTTGRVGMTTLEKLIYTADMIEDGRDFDGVEKLRTITENSLEEGFKECLKQTYLHLLNTNHSIYYLTKEAYDFYSEV